MKTYTLPASWDAAKFATRYNLNRDRDFYVDGNGKLVVFPTLPDDPPIFEPPDPFIQAPAGIHVHTMRQAEAKQGDKFITTQEESKCIHVVLNFETQLNDAWLITIPMDPGSSAYCRDTEKTWIWNGVAWKKP